MIERAKRALPGMVFSLLLSSPALASGVQGNKGNHPKVDQKPTSAVRHSGNGQDSKGMPAGAVLPTKADKLASAAKGNSVKNTYSASRARPAAHLHMRETAPDVLSSTGRGVIRRASTHLAHGKLSGGDLIDDGTLWREAGSLTTWQQTGVASWYGGRKWQGHRTSSGDRYDEHALTAAHATLPLGTKVRVVRHDGARSVIVTINDRPGTRTRIIDLSREAAKQLGILESGVAMVTLQPM